MEPNAGGNRPTITVRIPSFTGRLEGGGSGEGGGGGWRKVPQPYSLILAEFYICGSYSFCQSAAFDVCLRVILMCE